MSWPTLPAGLPAAARRRVQAALLAYVGAGGLAGVAVVGGLLATPAGQAVQEALAPAERLVEEQVQRPIGSFFEQRPPIPTELLTPLGPVLLAPPAAPALIDRPAAAGAGGGSPQPLEAAPPVGEEPAPGLTSAPAAPVVPTVAAPPEEGPGGDDHDQQVDTRDAKDKPGERKDADQPKAREADEEEHPPIRQVSVQATSAPPAEPKDRPSWTRGRSDGGSPSELTASSEPDDSSSSSDQKPSGPSSAAPRNSSDQKSGSDPEPSGDQQEPGEGHASNRKSISDQMSASDQKSGTDQKSGSDQKSGTQQKSSSDQRSGSDQEPKTDQKPSPGQASGGNQSTPAITASKSSRAVTAR